MKPRDYIPLACRTVAGDYNGIHNRLKYVSSMDTLHAALGMSSEAGEVLEIVGFDSMEEWDSATESDIIAELGDCCWYLNLACGCGWKTFHELAAHCLEKMGPHQGQEPQQEQLEDAAIQLGLFSGMFADMTKAFIFYGKSLNSELVVPVLEGYCCAIVLACQAIGVSLEDVLERNIAKLEARYGGKFSEFRAVNRDLSSEKDAYSK